jgi:clan AA aspartic protease (TIGR02281 family)
MEKVGRTYRLPCTVNGLSLNFILDTGADEVSISLSEALFMLKNGYIDENDLLNTEYYQLANGEIVEGTKLVLRTLKIGGLTIKNVEASIVHTMNAPLLLGQSALSKLGMITIDYAKNQLIINEKQEINAASKNSTLDFFLLGNDYYKKAEYSQAILYYTKSIEVKPFNPNAFYNRGLANYNLEKYSSAIEDFSMAITQNPNYSNAYEERANSKNKIGELKQAIEDYSIAIRLDSTDYSSFFERGGCYLDLKQYEEAIKDYNNSLKINNKHVYSFINRALAKFHTKKYVESLEDCERATLYSHELDSISTSSMYNIKGLNLYNLDKYPEAINNFNLSISFDKKNSKPVYNRGRAYYFSENLSLACNDWINAIQMGNSDAKFLLEKYCEERFAEITGTAESYYKLAESKFSNNKFSEAEKFYKKVLSLDSSFFLVYKKIAICNSRLQNYKDAILNFSISLKYFDQDKETYFLRGRAKYEIGKNIEAFEDYNRALNFDSKYDIALFNRGLVNYKLNKKEQACFDWSLALELGMKKAAELIKENCE